VKRYSLLVGLLGLVATVAATAVRADVVTDKGASILVFPKVVYTVTEDTIIQIANTTNNIVHARCFYVDARLPEGCTEVNPVVGCVPSWNETDFSIWLTKMQPTHWLVSAGRPVDPTDNLMVAGDTLGAPEKYSPGNGAGLDPGAIPPVPAGFTGELKCVQVMVDGTPIGANSLIGEATLDSTDGSSDVSKYNAIGIEGSELVGATGNTLLLNRPSDGSQDGEYNACPNTLLLNHFADGAPDPTTRITSTSITLVPCSEDFQRQAPSSVTVQFQIFNEFEERFSTSTTVTCWAEIWLYEIDSPNNPESSVFSYAQLGTLTAQTRITPASDLDGAVIGISETAHTEAVRVGVQAPLEGRTAVNIHTRGDRFLGTDGAAFDQIVLPELF